MPSLIDIRRRIRAVKSTQQITKAMKMVAASRMRRAHERIMNARPFSRQMLRVLHSLAGRVDPSAHPLLAVRDLTHPGAKIQLIIVTGDKGLAGSFNSNVVKAAGTFIVEHPGQSIELVLVGRKGRDFFRRRGFPVRAEHVALFTRLESRHAHAIAATAIEDFTTERADAVFIVYNEFKSIIQQRTV
ncbi:MAG TPA: F0F1 ATP synthase subunit gamma, partial [Methylomirabilota bacterium]